MLLIHRSSKHILRRLPSPPIRKVPMRAKRIPTRQLNRRLAGPSSRRIFPRIPPDAEPQLRHTLHTLGTHAPTPILVRRLQRSFIHAVGKVQQLLEMRGAGGAREAVLVERDGLGFAGPCALRVGVHVRGGGGGSDAGDHLEVLRDGHFGGGFAEFVVRGEAEEAERGPGFAGVEREERGGDPVGAEVVGVVGVGAAISYQRKNW